ncbi:MAG: hypothetical protein FJY07_00060 [Bacteroidetes bacterium]|nr:hypothetical protein [Bacteroidota bacterium]
MKIDMNPNEMVIRAGDCNHLSNGNSIKGKLILTNQRIYFKSEANAKNISDIEIWPEEIRDVMLYNNRLFFSSGLNIVTKSGRENKFLVKNRTGWSELIARMC